MADRTPSPIPRTTAGQAGCPNTPPCGHPAMIHDVSGDAEDPKPMCCADGCSCGQPAPELAAEPGPLPFEDRSVHLVGVQARLSGRHVRQRCAWCGHLLVDLVLDEPEVLTSNIPPAEHPDLLRAGRFVEVIGDTVTELPRPTDGALPDDCCALWDCAPLEPGIVVPTLADRFDGPETAGVDHD